MHTTRCGLVTDCCDGTDEYDGKVTCQDTCYALGEETRVAKRQELEAFKKVGFKSTLASGSSWCNLHPLLGQGLAIRDQYVQEAKVAKEEKRKKLEELQATVAQKQEERDKLKGNPVHSASIMQYRLNPHDVLFFTQPKSMNSRKRPQRPESYWPNISLRMVW